MMTFSHSSWVARHWSRQAPKSSCSRVTACQFHSTPQNQADSALIALTISLIRPNMAGRCIAGATEWD